MIIGHSNDWLMYLLKTVAIAGLSCDVTTQVHAHKAKVGGIYP